MSERKLTYIGGFYGPNDFDSSYTPEYILAKTEYTTNGSTALVLYGFAEGSDGDCSRETEVISVNLDMFAVDPATTFFDINNVGQDMYETLIEKDAISNKFNRQQRSGYVSYPLVNIVDFENVPTLDELVNLPDDELRKLIEEAKGKGDLEAGAEIDFELDL